MKKLLAILVALMMVFTLTTAGATVTGDTEGEVKLNFEVTGTLTETPVDEIEIIWGEADGSLEMTISGSRTWNTETHAWNEPTVQISGTPSLTLPQFSVSVINHSSPGHDYQGAVTVTCDDLGQANLLTTTLTAQTASSVFGTSPAVIPSDLGTTTAQRTKTLTYSFAGLTASSIANDDFGGLIGWLSMIGDLGTGTLSYDNNNGNPIWTAGTSTYENWYEESASIAITAVSD